MEDAFIREHIEDLLRNIRTQVTQDLALKGCWSLYRSWSSWSSLTRGSRSSSSLVSWTLSLVMWKVFLCPAFWTTPSVAGSIRSLSANKLSGILISENPLQNVICGNNHSSLRCPGCWNLTRAARVLQDTWRWTSGTTSWTICRSLWSIRWLEKLCQDVI